jgi:hypothetical protein
MFVLDATSIASSRYDRVVPDSSGPRSPRTNFMRSLHR